ncbi:MAG: phytoene desaturase family protein [Candidatus Thermoplasmatota archaeon]|nr:phytoene desaturase family protein [Candidatus Thermoplasmatota archaeon]MED5273498.1 phytoene desaturase family protein [Candidatus Thermoplasmatota archaeon]
MDEHSDVIVVGAGPGGLACSMLLAKAGVKVTILEKSDDVGGRTRVFEKDGYKYDNGPTFFHYPEIAEEIFEALGMDAHEELGLIPLHPNYRLVFGAGGSLNATTDLEDMVSQIGELCGERNANGFRRYIEDNRKKLRLSKNCLNTPWSGPADLLSRRALRVSRVLKPWRSVSSDLSKLFPDERMQLAMSFQTKYLGMSPFQAPSLFTILAYLEYEHGVFHSEGGLGTITQKMGKIARDLGVEIRLNEPVREFVFDGKRVVGARTDEKTYSADRFVMNVDFATGMKGLIPDELRKRWSNKKLDEKSYSCSTYMLYLGIDKLYDTPHHQIYAAKDYQKNLKEVTEHKVTWDDPSIYVQNACVTDPTMAPDGHSTIYVLVPVSNSHEGINWDEIKDDYMDVILGQMENLGFSGIKDHIVSQTIVTPDDWASRDIYKGAVFNLAHGLDQMLWRRPQNKFEELDRLYLVGGGTHPGSGLPTILESGRISAKMICADMGIAPDWNGAETWFEDMRRPTIKSKR